MATMENECDVSMTDVHVQSLLDQEGTRRVNLWTKVVTCLYKMSVLVVSTKYNLSTLPPP